MSRKCKILKRAIQEKEQVSEAVADFWDFCRKISEASTVGVKRRLTPLLLERGSYCEVFKDTYFEKHLGTAASKNQHLSGKFRSSRLEVFCKKGVLRHFAEFTGKQLRQSLFFNKVAGLRPWHRCFPVNFVKFLRISFLTEHLRWLLLFSYKHIFVIKKLQHLSSEMLWFLHRWDYCWKYEFSTDVKKENYYHHEEEQLLFYISKHRAIRRMFL